MGSAFMGMNGVTIRCAPRIVPLLICFVVKRPMSASLTVLRFTARLSTWHTEGFMAALGASPVEAPHEETCPPVAEASLLCCWVGAELLAERPDRVLFVGCSWSARCQLSCSSSVPPPGRMGRRKRS